MQPKRSGSDQMIGVIELKGYHIVAAEEDGIYTIVIPEYPNILVTAADPAEIVTVASAAVEKEKRAHVMKTAICPICKKAYTGYPAVSRKDSKTEICPDCGIREALDAAGVGEEQKNTILGEIHRLQEKDHENDTVS